MVSRSTKPFKQSVVMELPAAWIDRKNINAIPIFEVTNQPRSFYRVPNKIWCDCPRRLEL